MVDLKSLQRHNLDAPIGKGDPLALQGHAVLRRPPPVNHRKSEERHQALQSPENGERAPARTKHGREGQAPRRQGQQVYRQEHRREINAGCVKEREITRPGDLVGDRNQAGEKGRRGEKPPEPDLPGNRAGRSRLAKEKKCRGGNQQITDAPGHAGPVHAKRRDGKIGGAQDPGHRAQDVDAVEEAGPRANRAVFGHQPIQQKRKRASHKKGRDEHQGEQQPETQREEAAANPRRNGIERAVGLLQQEEEKREGQGKEADHQLKNAVNKKRGAPSGAEPASDKIAAKRDSQEK